MTDIANLSDAQARAAYYRDESVPLADRIQVAERFGSNMNNDQAWCSNLKAQALRSAAGVRTTPTVAATQQPTTEARTQLLADIAAAEESGNVGESMRLKSLLLKEDVRHKEAAAQEPLVEPKASLNAYIDERNANDNSATGIAVREMLDPATRAAREAEASRQAYERQLAERQRPGAA